MRGWYASAEPFPPWKSSFLHGCFHLARKDALDGDRGDFLHGFIKKTQKTQQSDLDLALRRKKGEGA
jgi:hypothetical protein